MEILDKAKYLEALREKAKKSRISKPFQYIGLEIAITLHDLEHKALYIKMSKEHDSSRLLQLAKEISERRDVKNPGAYFMKMVQTLKSPGVTPRVIPNQDKRNMELGFRKIGS